MKADKNEGWASEYCTKERCRTALDGGAGNQFVDEKKKEQRYCWKHWQEHNRDPKRFVQEIK